jgi:hypothetical protein
MSQRLTTRQPPRGVNQSTVREAGMAVELVAARLSNGILSAS